MTSIGAGDPVFVDFGGGVRRACPIDSVGPASMTAGGRRFNMHRETDGSRLGLLGAVLWDSEADCDRAAWDRRAVEAVVWALRGGLTHGQLLQVVAVLGLRP